MCKNLLLITIDCLRKDHLGCYGYRRDTTPNIDAIAGGSMVYENMFSNGPFTVASFVSLLGGVPPLMYGKMAPLPKEVPLVSQSLKKCGVSTCAVHSNPYLSSKYGYDRGWDLFQDFLKDSDTARRSPSFLGKFLPKGIRDRLYFRRLAYSRHSFYADAGRINAQAADWLDGCPDSPFFLWVHYMDVHEPYTLLDGPERRFAEMSRGGNASLLYRLHRKKVRGNSPDSNKLIDLYDDRVRYVDGKVGELIGVLKDAGVYSDTALIVTSDHGQQFFEHGSFGHKGFFFEENIRVPFIIKGVDKGRDARLASLMDIPPTIMGLLSPGAETSYPGLDLCSLSTPPREYVICEASMNDEGVYVAYNEVHAPTKKVYCIRTDRYKLIYSTVGERILFDLAADPLEQHNVFGEATGAARILEEAIVRHIRMEDRQRLSVRMRKKGLSLPPQRGGRGVG